MPSVTDVCGECNATGKYCGGRGQEPRPCSYCNGNGFIEVPEDEMDEWDEWDCYEEDGPMDLEDQLEAALNRASHS